MVVAGPYYAVLPEWAVHEVLLEVEGEAKERLKAVVQRQKAAQQAPSGRLG